MKKPSITIISGLSGSGKTVALRALEDIGFFCADNIPPVLIDSFVSTIAGKGGHKGVVIGIDIREKEFLWSMDPVIKELRKKYNVEIVFLDAEPKVLLRRFKETRRPHPLKPGDTTNLEEAITREMELLKPLRDSADRIIDTSSFSPHQLRKHISSLLEFGTGSCPLTLTIISFGYKYGIPQSADLIMDVRFLPNPHFVPELRELTGADEPVKEFVKGNPETTGFIERFGDLLDYLIPLYLKEGKSYLTLGIGCTGGRHRSPVIVEMVAALLKKHPVGIEVVHRDM